MSFLNTFLLSLLLSSNFITSPLLTSDTQLTHFKLTSNSFVENSNGVTEATPSDHSESASSENPQVNTIDEEPLKKTAETSEHINNQDIQTDAPTENTADNRSEAPEKKPKLGPTIVGNLSDLKSALENGESVQLTNDIEIGLLGGLLTRIQLGKNNPQDITIDGKDPTTGVHHKLKYAGTDVLSGETQIHFRDNMKGKTITFANIEIDNNNYYGICHGVGDTPSDTSTLVLHNVKYTGDAQTLHFNHGTVRFSGINSLTQTKPLLDITSQEFAEVARLEFVDGQTTINHEGSERFMWPYFEPSNNKDNNGIFVSGGAKVNITTNQELFGASGGDNSHQYLNIDGVGSSLTVNAEKAVFQAVGSEVSSTNVTNGGNLTITKATDYYATGSKNAGIYADNQSTIKMDLHNRIYATSQTNSPIKATNHSTIDITAVNDIYAADAHDSHLSATNQSMLKIKTNNDLYTNTLTPSANNTSPLIEVGTQSQIDLQIANAVLRNTNDTAWQIKNQGTLNLTAGQFHAISSPRAFKIDLLDNSTTNWTINGSQNSTTSYGLIPLQKTGAYLNIADHATVNITNQTTTTHPVIAGPTTTGVTSPITIGDSQLTITNNGKARLLQKNRLKFENPTSATAHEIYRSLAVTQNTQTKQFAFAHLDWLLNNNSTTVTSTDDRLTTYLQAITNTNTISKLVIANPTPPIFETVDNTGGIPTEGASEFTFDVAGVATAGSLINLNFIDANQLSLLKSPSKTTPSSHQFTHHYQATIPPQRHQIVLELDYPAPYQLTKPIQYVLKALPSGEIKFLQVPNQINFGQLLLTNSRSDFYQYQIDPSQKLIISDTRDTAAADWSIQLNLKQAFTAQSLPAASATLDNSLYLRQNALNTVLPLNTATLFYQAQQAVDGQLDLSEHLHEQLQARFEAGRKQAETPYQAQLEFTLVLAPT